MVDDPRDAFECFGSAPIDALAIGPYLVRRASLFAAPARTERAIVA
jgi:carbamoyltransferase